MVAAIEAESSSTTGADAKVTCLEHYDIAVLKHTF